MADINMIFFTRENCFTLVIGFSSTNRSCSDYVLIEPLDYDNTIIFIQYFCLAKDNNRKYNFLELFLCYRFPAVSDKIKRWSQWTNCQNKMRRLVFEQLLETRKLYLPLGTILVPNSRSNEGFPHGFVPWYKSKLTLCSDFLFRNHIL